MNTVRRIEKVPPTPDELREQIRLEIENKSKSCSNSTYACSLPRIDGYEFCLRHILKDPQGHYKQCAYSYSNGRKCQNALPKYDNKKDPTLTAYCFEHSRQAQLNKTRAAIGKLRVVDSNEVFLNNLAHHLNVKEPLNHRKTSVRCSGEEEIDVVSSQEEAFVSFKHVHNIDKTMAEVRKRRRILDYASDSSNDNPEPICLKNTSNSLHFGNSDDDSIDSTDRDFLKHSEIYTRQEIVRISEMKLIKLQSLYISQINQLHSLLKDRRRKYLTALRKEREILCSIHDQAKETKQERLLYKQLKAYNTYHQRHGIDAVLHKKFKEKRAKTTEGYGYKPPSFAKCVYTEGGVKCATRALPCCKYCRKHILEDKKQTLFRACSVDKAGVVCQEAIPCIFDDSTCVLHMPFPAKKIYFQKKYESETEEDESLTGCSNATVANLKSANKSILACSSLTVGSPALQSLTKVKTEFNVAPSTSRPKK